MTRMGREETCDAKPIGLKWRSSSTFIICTVAIGLFTDLFLYGLIVPILPFILSDRLLLPHSSIQTYSSLLLSIYAACQVVFSLPAGFLADRLSSRQLPFLCGIASLFASTILLWLGQALWVLIVARMFQGVSAAVVWTVGMALIMDTVGSGKLGTVMGSMFSFISVGELVAPVLGGILYRKVGDGAVFMTGLALLVIDFTMRVILIEKKTAAKYLPAEDLEESSSETLTEEDGDENTPLIAKEEPEDWIINTEDQPEWLQHFPVVYCLQNPRFLTAQAICFFQACLIGAFEATIPTEALDLFGFDSLKAGLLFIPFILPYLVCGPIIGRAVDKYGTKPAGVIGFLWMVIPLVLLRIPKSGDVVLFCVLLSLSGLGFAFISPLSIVESSYVVEKYYKANKTFFGERGPYAQMYAFNSIFFCSGLTIGPMIAGFLREQIGYGNMNTCAAGLSFLVAILSFTYLGGKPKVFTRR